MAGASPGYNHTGQQLLKKKKEQNKLRRLYMYTQCQNKYTDKGQIRMKQKKKPQNNIFDFFFSLDLKPYIQVLVQLFNQQLLFHYHDVVF